MRIRLRRFSNRFAIRFEHIDMYSSVFRAVQKGKIPREAKFFRGGMKNKTGLF